MKRPYPNDAAAGTDIVHFFLRAPNTANREKQVRDEHTDTHL
jgi:hypothetical protein